MYCCRNLKLKLRISILKLITVPNFSLIGLKFKPEQKMVEFQAYQVTKLEYDVILTSQLVISISLLLFYGRLPISNCMRNFSFLGINPGVKNTSPPPDLHAHQRPQLRLIGLRNNNNKQSQTKATITLCDLSTVILFKLAHSLPGIEIS